MHAEPLERHSPGQAEHPAGDVAIGAGARAVPETAFADSRPAFTPERYTARPPNGCKKASRSCAVVHVRRRP